MGLAHKGGIAAALLLALVAARPAAAQDARPAPPVTAAPAPTADGPSFSIETDTDVVVRADRTSTMRHMVRLQILKEAALRGIGQQSIGFVEGMETLDIVAAFTTKADGRRLAVDPATIITRDAASGLNAVYLRDTKTRTLIFPDIAVGDTLEYTTLRLVREPSFEGHFTYNSIFHRGVPWIKAVQTVTAPADLPLNVHVRGDGLTHVRGEDGGTVRHRFTYLPTAPPVRDEPGAVAASDREPAVIVTTFRDYGELGAAYWKEAAGRIEVTPQIQALAEEIVRGHDGKRAQAEAIDHWMKRHIRYVAVYLGRQRWIPNPATAVLTNRYGDCKDHATLMSALLKARGIASEHVLINLGSAYALSELPPGNFNHAILHLPEFGIYADPTATLAAFGVLALQAYDKPVVLVSDAGPRLGRTPPMRAEDHATIARTRATIAADGTVSGETSQTATGFLAASARSAFLGLQGGGLELGAERMLQGLNTPGKGRFEAASPSELKEPYVVKSTFTLADKLALPLAGNRRTPVGLPLHSRPGTFLLGNRHAGRKEAFSCFAGRQVEEIEIEFASGLPLPRRQLPRMIETAAFTYTASHNIENRTLRVRREFVSKVAGQICAPVLEAEIAEPLKAVLANVGGVMVFGGPSGEGGGKK